MKRLIGLILILACVGWFAPVRATDYTFGGDTTGTTHTAISDSSYYLDTATTPAYAGTLDSCIVWLDANYKGPHSVAMIVYEVAGPDTSIIDSTAHFTVSTSSHARYSAAFIEKAAVTANTKYLYGLQFASAGGTDGALRLVDNDGVHVGEKYKLTGVPVIPATITGPTAEPNGHKRAQLVYYHDAGAPASTSARRRILGGM